jgi:DNA-binding CsgD family transcriptional regulator
VDTDLIAWDDEPRELAADPAATLSVDRVRWEKAGANFASYVDDIGGSTAIATATTRGLGEEVLFGVLDYGETTSYLLVSGSYEEHGNSVDAVLQALIVEGAIAPADVLERLPSALAAAVPEPTTTEMEYKLAGLAQEVAELRAQATVAADVIEPVEGWLHPSGPSRLGAEEEDVERGRGDRASPGFRWYVVNTYSGHETRVTQELERRVVALNQRSHIRQVIVPAVPAPATKGRSKIAVEQVVAPGYVLVNMALNNESLRLVKGTPGVTGFAGTSSDSSRANLPYPASVPSTIASRPPKLTPRETRVLALVAEGLPTREIGEQLHYSERTVKEVLHDIVVKLGARSRSPAITRAIRQGLI